MLGALYYEQCCAFALNALSPDNRGMNRTRFLFAGVLLLATAAFAAKEFIPPRAFHAKTYPARDEHSDESVTIAADPYDTPDKAAIFTLKYAEKDYLPVLLVISNDRNQPITLSNMQVQLVTSNRSKITSADEDDLFRRFSRVKKRGDEPSHNPLPIPLPRHPDAGVPKGGAQEIDSAIFKAKAVEPKALQSGFVFFDITGQDHPLAGAHLYVTGVRDGNGNELMFFDIAMEKYLSYKPGTTP